MTGVFSGVDYGCLREYDGIEKGYGVMIMIGYLSVSAKRLSFLTSTLEYATKIGFR